MQIKETPLASFPRRGLEDVVVLADSAGVALGVQRVFGARLRSVSMTAAASSRPGAWRFRSSGVVAKSPRSCAGPPHGPIRAACSPPAGGRGRGRSGA
jgi:hypothetical protein